MQSTGQTGARYTWDARTRVLHAHYPRDVTLSEALGHEVVAEVASHWGANGESVGLLVDCHGIPGVSAGHREVVARFFRTNRARTRIACYRMSGPLRVVALLFGKATGVPIRAFPDEASARAWLEEACAPETRRQD